MLLLPRGNGEMQHDGVLLSNRNSQDRSNMPRQRTSQEDRQLSTAPVSVATAVIDGNVSGHNLFELSLIGTALSVPTLQAQHVEFKPESPLRCPRTAGNLAPD